MLCYGDDAPMRLIRDKLEIGERLGEVPPETPAVPLAARPGGAAAAAAPASRRPRSSSSTSICATRPTASAATCCTACACSTSPWGEPQRTLRHKPGTFHEFWTLQWQPEFAVALIEANVWGNTVERAATAVRPPRRRQGATTCRR